MDNRTAPAFKKQFDEFIDSRWHSGFFNRDWFSPQSTSYQTEMHSWLVLWGMPVYEFESSTFDADTLISTIIKGHLPIDANKSSFRLLCDFIETAPPSIISVYRCSELTSTGVQLLSQLSRFIESSSCEWKLVYFGSYRRLRPLNLKLLAPQVMVGVAAVNNDALTKRRQSVSPLLGFGAALTLLLVAALLGGFWGTSEVRPFEGNPRLPSQQNATDKETIEVEQNDNVAQVEGSTDAQELLAWAEHVAEFEAAMASYSETSVAPISIPEIAQERTGNTWQNTTKGGDSRPLAFSMTAEMMRAANEGSVAGFESTLINRQAVNATSRNNDTALTIASLKGHQDLVSWLLDNGADVRWEDSDQRTALYYAAVNGHYAIAENLLRNNANTNHLGKLNKTALMAAVNNRYDSLSSLLVQAGADVNQQDHSGWSALFYAVWNSDEAIVNLLLAAGANLSLRDKDGYTVMDVANAKGAANILSLLVAAGAS